MPLITFDRLKVHQDCEGDFDLFARTGSEREFQLFGDQDNATWSFIDSALQNIELISKKLTSPAFTSQILSELKENSDEKSFIELTSRISFYQGFQEVANLVAIIKDKMAVDTDFVYTRFESLSELEEYLDICIDSLKSCDFEKLGKVRLDFAPTGTYQELSIRNGWPDEYLKLANEFDNLYESICTNITASDIVSAKLVKHKSNIFAKLWSRVFVNS